MAKSKAKRGLDKWTRGAIMNIESEISPFCYIVRPALQLPSEGSKVGLTSPGSFTSRFTIDRSRGFCVCTTFALTQSPRIDVNLREVSQKGTWLPT